MDKLFVTASGNVGEYTLTNDFTALTQSLVDYWTFLMPILYVLRALKVITTQPNKTKVDQTININCQLSRVTVTVSLASETCQSLPCIKIAILVGKSRIKKRY